MKCAIRNINRHVRIKDSVRGYVLESIERGWFIKFLNIMQHKGVAVNGQNAQFAERDTGRDFVDLPEHVRGAVGLF